MSKRLLFVSLAISLVFVLSGCGSSSILNGSASSTESNAGASSAPKEPAVKPVKLSLNWFPQAENGGHYAAMEKGFYREKGLDVTIEPGGPGISSTQIVASGKADFGIGIADEVLLARDNGIPLVAIFGTFQMNPQGISIHKGQNVRRFEDLNGRTIYVAKGALYWDYIKKKYNLSKMSEMAFTGNKAGFLSDPTATMQNFITNEAFIMKQQGVDIDMLPVSDSGYNPYAKIVFTTEKFIKEHPEEVKAFVEATAEGWNYFKDNYKEIASAVQKANTKDSLELVEYASTASIPLVFQGDAEANGVGYMSKERWETLGNQLSELKLLKSAPDVSKAYTTEFLPKK